MGQTGSGRALQGERPMGTAAYGGTGFKERTRVRGDRTSGPTSFRRQSIQASCHPPPPLKGIGGGDLLQRESRNP